MIVRLTEDDIRNALANYVHHVLNIDVKCFSRVDIFVDDNGAELNFSEQCEKTSD